MQKIYICQQNANVHSDGFYFVENGMIRFPQSTKVRVGDKEFVSVLGIRVGKKGCVLRRTDHQCDLYVFSTGELSGIQQCNVHCPEAAYTISLFSLNKKGVFCEGAEIGVEELPATTLQIDMDGTLRDKSKKHAWQSIAI